MSTNYTKSKYTHHSSSSQLPPFPSTNTTNNNSYEDDETIPSLSSNGNTIRSFMTLSSASSSTPAPATVKKVKPKNAPEPRSGPNRPVFVGEYDYEGDDEPIFHNVYAGGSSSAVGGFHPSSSSAVSGNSSAGSSSEGGIMSEDNNPTLTIGGVRRDRAGLMRANRMASQYTTLTTSTGTTPRINNLADGGLDSCSITTASSCGDYDMSHHQRRRRRSNDGDKSVMSTSSTTTTTSSTTTKQMASHNNNNSAVRVENRISGGLLNRHAKNTTDTAIPQQQQQQTGLPPNTIIGTDDPSVVSHFTSSSAGFTTSSSSNKSNTPPHQQQYADLSSVSTLSTSSTRKHLKYFQRQFQQQQQAQQQQQQHHFSSGQSASGSSYTGNSNNGGTSYATAPPNLENLTISSSRNEEDEESITQSVLSTGGASYSGPFYHPEQQQHNQNQNVFRAEEGVDEDDSYDSVPHSQYQQHQQSTPHRRGAGSTHGIGSATVANSDTATYQQYYNPKQGYVNKHRGGAVSNANSDDATYQQYMYSTNVPSSTSGSLSGRGNSTGAIFNSASPPQPGSSVAGSSTRQYNQQQQTVGGTARNVTHVTHVQQRSENMVPKEERGMQCTTPYQIEYELQDLGKRVGGSKKQAKWKFGFTNPQALSTGQTGPNCRGEEHEIILNWSLSSNKKQVVLNSKEIHYSSNRTNFVNVAWNMVSYETFQRDLKVLAFAQMPSKKDKVQRQFDLIIDGQSFFDLPKVYELGMTKSSPAPPPVQQQGGIGGRRTREPPSATTSTSPPPLEDDVSSHTDTMSHSSGGGSSHRHAADARLQEINDEKDLQKAIAANINNVRMRCQVRQS